MLCFLVFRRTFAVALLLAVAPHVLLAQEASTGSRPATKLEFSRWSGALNVPDPVAISFDHQGRAYVTQTQRRKSQDLDIRAHRDWIPADVGFESVADKRAFYHRELATPATGKSSGKRRVKDFNGDGVSDYRDLMVISEKLHLMEDTNGDGTADRTQLFADGFQTEVTGIAAGVLWHDDAVYATIAPDVWKLKDTDGDGRADQREVMATGFGLHIAYAGHDMHGLTVGPDGKIYWTVGDKGISATSREGQRYHYPNQGGVMRCNPDGSDFEVFAHGLRNVQELAFDDFGNLFGVDNDADQPGERERVVYIVRGMDAGWRCNYQYRGDGYNPWTAEKLWQTWHKGQAAYITPPLAYSLNGPAGFAFNPGTALSPDYRGYFFLTGAPGGEQRAFQLRQNGASFQVANEHEIGRGVPLVGINFGPDGALYGVDWGGGYPLNQKGAVWKIDAPDANDWEARRETQRLLAEGFKQRATDQLVGLLAHADQRVRLAAQFELVKREEDEPLMRVALDAESHRIARIHAIWGLGQRMRTGQRSAIDAVEQLLEDADAEIRVQSLRMIGDLTAYDGDAYSKGLRDPEPRVRLQTALTLREHPTSDALPALTALAATLQPDEVYMRHAVAYGMSGQNAAELSKLSKHDSPTVRLSAVLALRHRYDSYQVESSDYLASFLNDAEPTVRSEGARAIYEMISRYGFDKESPLHAELRGLAGSLLDSSAVDEAYLRRAIGAAYLLGGAAEAEMLARYATRKVAPPAMRIDALRALREWDKPPKLDRVDGRRRRHEKVERATLPLQAIATAAGLFSADNPIIRAAALQTLRELNPHLVLTHPRMA